MSRTAVLAPALLTLAFAPASAPAAPARPAAPRAAIVVGANAAALGRAALRHAHRDSQAIAEVLRSVGRFDARDVHVLHDPAPDEVIALVEREAATLAGKPDGMLLFYYSGHADRDALYPGGKPLAIDRLRRVLDRADVSVRVGVIDACQGGAWTRAKGLVPDAPFEVAIPAVLGSEGSALIASSSGVESAHESDLLQGSFFTYHFAAALRGAGDRSGDGAVTLTEAYDYARERTIRDSARLSPEPQHPSYALNVRGRQDIVLAHVSDSASTLAVDQQEGPLELVHLASGLRILELPAGRRSLTLAVPPGKYLVRRVAQEGIRTREVDVPRDGTAQVREGELVLLAAERLAVKGERREGALASLPGGGGWDLEVGVDPYARSETFALAIGARLTEEGLLRVDGRLGLTDRLTWKIGTLGFAYGIATARGWELVPFGGITGWTVDLSGSGWRESDVMAVAGAGFGVQRRFGPAAAVWTGEVERRIGSETSEKVPPDYGARGAFGVTLHLGKIVTLHVAYGLETRSYPAHDVDIGFGTVAHYPARRASGWSLGSIQEVGFASLPLVAVHAPRGWSLNAYLTATTLDRYTSGEARVGISKLFR